MRHASYHLKVPCFKAFQWAYMCARWIVCLATPQNLYAGGPGHTPLKEAEPMIRPVLRSNSANRSFAHRVRSLRRRVNPLSPSMKRVAFQFFLTRSVKSSCTTPPVLLDFMF